MDNKGNLTGVDRFRRGRVYFSQCNSTTESLGLGLLSIINFLAPFYC